MSHRRSGNGVPPPPPPPSLNKYSASRSSKQNEKNYKLDRPSESKRTRSRSKTPEEKRSRYLRTQYHKSRSKKTRSRSKSKSPREIVGSSRNNESSSRNRAPALPATIASHSASSSSALKLPPGPSSAKVAATSSAIAMMTPAISLISPQEFTSINRSITNPEDVKIPRRIGEGARPIFDRLELRDAIQRRMEAGDNEVNPNYVQIPEVINQRVVAIIREPVEVMGHPMKPPVVASSSSHSLAPELGNIGQSHLDRYNSILMSRDRRSPSPHVRSRNLSPPSHGSGSSKDRGERIRDKPINHFKSPERSDRRSRARSRVRSRSRSRSQERFVKERNDDRNISNASLGVERFREHDRTRGQQHPRESVREIHYEEELRRQAPPESDTRERDLGRRELSRERNSNPYLERVSRSRSRTPPVVPRHFHAAHEIQNRDREVRERDRDLRNTLSRPPGKVYHGSRPYDDDQSRNFRGNSMRSRGRGRGSSFRSRDSRNVSDSVDATDKSAKKSSSQEILLIRRNRDSLPRGNWQHDLYDEEMRR